MSTPSRYMDICVLTAATSFSNTILPLKLLTVILEPKGMIKLLSDDDGKDAVVPPFADESPGSRQNADFGDSVSSSPVAEIVDSTTRPQDKPDLNAIVMYKTRASN